MKRDPVCGMEVEPQSSFASREHMGQVYFFCSKNCVELFDQNPHHYTQLDLEPSPLAGSVTTGYNPDLPLGQVELPIVGLKKDGNPGAILIRSAVEKLPGVERVIISPIEGVAVVQYDPDKVQVLDLVGAIKKSGYQVGGAEKRIGIKNLHCTSCVQFIENDLKATPGVLSASVSITSQEATIAYLPQQTSLQQLDATIESWGYKTQAAASEQLVEQQEAAHEKEYRSLMNKFWLAAIVSIPVLITAYPQFFPIIRDWSMETLRTVWLGAAVLTIPVLLYSGGHFFTGAWAALKHRSANMNTLIARGRLS